MTKQVFNPPVSEGRRRPWYVDVAVLIAILPIAASAVRVWLYSGGDTALFLTLVRTIDLPTVIVGTSAVLAQSAVLFLIALVLIDWKTRARVARWFKSPWAQVAFSVTAMVVLLTASVTFWLGILVLVLLVVLHFVFKAIPGLRRIASGLVPSRESGRRPDVTVNPPGVFGDSIPWKDQSHGTTQQVSARAS